MTKEKISAMHLSLRGRLLLPLCLLAVTSGGMFISLIISQRISSQRSAHIITERISQSQEDLGRETVAQLVDDLNPQLNQITESAALADASRRLQIDFSMMLLDWKNLIAYAWNDAARRKSLENLRSSMERCASSAQQLYHLLQEDVLSENIELIVNRLTTLIAEYDESTMMIDFADDPAIGARGANERMDGKEDPVFAAIEEIVDLLLKRMQVASATARQTASTIISDGISASFHHLSEEISQVQNSQNQQQQHELMRWSILSLLFALLLLIIAWISINRLSSMISSIIDVQGHVARGSLDVDLEARHLGRGDVLGKLACSVEQMIHSQREFESLCARLADGDWRIEVPLRSELDGLGNALNRMIEKVSWSLIQVQTSSHNIDSRSSQIADTAGLLSEGASESAASLEQIAASIAEVAHRARVSAEQAEHAKTSSEAAQVAARNGSLCMDTLRQAMESISVSSKRIAHINQVIDDIAFQTNLLALNAAVEAARAGRHGKGFAVVADEVRSLAGRSTKAAAETSELIEQALIRVASGEDAVKQTEGALGEITNAVRNSGELMQFVVESAQEQAEAVGQINQGLSQIDQVTQANTASAEQTAAAVKELSEQAVELRMLVETFRLKETEKALIV